jgi:hypothetical protein
VGSRRQRTLLGKSMALTLLALVASILAEMLVIESRSRAAAPPPNCEGTRWAVKTLSDKRARLVRLKPRPQTVRGLRRLRPPRRRTVRIRGVETHTYVVKARLVEAKIQGDGDIHLVIADMMFPAKTMIVEFPDPACTSESKFRRRIAQARKAIMAQCGFLPHAGFRMLTGTATVTGVGFFDSVHGQPGVAPNGIELHPVLGFSADSCGPS